MKITVSDKLSPGECSAADLAAYYKWSGVDRQASYSQYVRDRNLSPDMDAKAFFAIFDSVTPAPLPSRVRQSNFSATHRDTLLGVDCQIQRKANGVFDILWADGHTGSNPPSDPPEPDRFVPL